MAHNNIISSFVTRFIIFLYGWVLHVCTRSNGTFNRRLLSLIDFKISAPATKLILNKVRVSSCDITVDSSRNLWFRIFTPIQGSNLLPLIVYFHGGGFSNYGPDSIQYNGLCSSLAAAVPAVVVSVNYRLAPDHKYPSQYEDGFDVFKFIDGKYNDILPVDTDISKCFIGGDSAGGNIAHHVTVRVVENGEQFHNIKIVGILALQPFFGGEERTESELRLRKGPLITLNQTDVFWREFLPEGADRNHPAANVFDGGAKSEADEALKNLDFPTTLVIVGGNDPLQDWDRRYVEWLESCGKRVELIEYPNACHSFYSFPQLPEFALLLERVADFVHKQLNEKLNI